MRSEAPPVPGTNVLQAAVRGPSYALLSLAVAIPLLAPIFLSGWFMGHDVLHPLRLFEQDVMIRAGHFPVRWYPDVAAGYGSAHPVYYAPLFYLIAQLFVLAGLPIDLSLKLTLAVVLLTTAWVMYRLVSRWFGPGPGLVAAAAVTYAPYHLVDLYVRTSFSELTVFATLPLALVAFERLGRTPDRRSTALAGLAFGALLLTHTITTMIAPALLGLWVGLLCLNPEYRARTVIRSAGGAALLGLGLAAFFLIPLALERDHINVGWYTTGFYSFDNHFVQYPELLWSPWGWGGAQGMSLRLGEFQILGALLGLLVWFRIRRSAAVLRPVVWLGVLFTLAAILALPASRLLWEHLGPLQLFQFPWRFLVFPALGMAVLCGLASRYSETRPKRTQPSTRAFRWPSPLTSFLTVGLVASGLPFLGFKDRVPTAAAHFARDSTLYARLSGNAAVELRRDFVRATAYRWSDHLPYGALTRPTSAETGQPAFEVVSGTAAVETMIAGPVRYQARVSASDTATIRLNVHRDPGWDWRLNGRSVESVPVKGRRVHLMRVPPGLHEVEAVLVRTGPRIVGDSVTLLSLAVVIVLSFYKGRFNAVTRER